VKWWQVELESQLDLDTHYAAWERGKTLPIAQVVAAFKDAPVPVSL